MKKQTIIYSIFLAILLFMFWHSSVNAANLSTLGASTFLGGGKSDVIRDMVIVNNAVYVIGETSSVGFPFSVTGYDVETTGIDVDVFVAKLSLDLSQVYNMSYFGGLSKESGYGISADPSGNLYITGTTLSSDFPTSTTGYDLSYNGWEDAFVVKLSKDLQSVLGTTFYSSAGFGTEKATDIIIGKDGGVYISGHVNNGGLPVTGGAYSQTYSGGGDDAFIAKFSSDLKTLTAATYFGGNDVDVAHSLAQNSAGDIILAGYTHSKNLPIKIGAYDVGFNGNPLHEDAFVAKFSSNLGVLQSATFIGGTEADVIEQVAIDSSDNIYVAGWTLSTNFPTTAGVHDTVFAGQNDAFVAKFNFNLQTLSAATYVGGLGSEMGDSLTLDTAGNVYLVGKTGSSDFPKSAGVYSAGSPANESVFVTKLSSGLQLLSATYIGGSNTDHAYAISLGPNDTIYVAGLTQSPNYPVSSGAAQKTYGGNGDWDGFISVFGTPSSAQPLSNPLQITKGEFLPVSIPVNLKTSFISNLVNSTGSILYTIQPISIKQENGGIQMLYSTNNLTPGSYTLTLIDSTTKQVLAQSGTFQILPKEVVYVLNAPKVPITPGTDITLKVYPGLYAYDKLSSGEYAIVWKDVKGDIMPLTPSVWPTKGFSLLLPITYSTTGLMPGTYTIELKENTKLGKIFTSTSVILAEQISPPPLQPAYNPRAFTQYQQSLKKGRPTR